MLKMPRFEENLDRETRQACLVLSGKNMFTAFTLLLGHFETDWAWICYGQNTHGDTLVKANYV